MNTKEAVVALIALATICPTILAQSDKIFLEDGQVLAGQLANPSILFQTAYGTIEIPNSAVRKIERKKESGENDVFKELLTTVNEERISGFFANEYVELSVGGGPDLHIRKELIRSVVYGPRTKTQLLARDYFVMKNNDVFYGTVLDSSFQLTTSYGAYNTAFANIMKIEEVAGGQTRLYLSDGNTVQGFIATDYIRVRTNYGFEMRIPKSSLKVIQLRR
jgi:hypothetical protein